jgi:transcription antitermination factor NusG
MQVLDDMAESALIGRNRTWSQPNSPAPTPSGCFRWHCVATKYGQQTAAEAALAAAGWPVFFPLHLDRRTQRIGPLWPGYGAVAFDLDEPHWPAIYRTHGIFTILSNDRRPVPFPAGIIEELIARTSPRRIVDDPGSAPFPDPAPTRQHWQNITALSADARTALLLRLFGRT